MSSNDAWAVGYDSASGHDVNLVEHWDGISWSLVTPPGPTSTAEELAGVAAISANDVWAVGYAYNRRGVPITVTAHWNGRRWRVVSSPSPGVTGSFLRGVSATASNDVWAVGDTSDANHYGSTLVEHWDGTSWSVVPSPNTPTHTNFVFSVSAYAPNGAWAVGYGGSNGTLMEEWDGTSWQIVPHPEVGEFESVWADSPTDAWAVGQGYIPPSEFPTLVEHWDGAAWTVVLSPSVGPANLLQGVWAASPTIAWAVGSAQGLQLIEHLC